MNKHILNFIFYPSLLVVLLGFSTQINLSHSASTDLTSLNFSSYINQCNLHLSAKNISKDTLYLEVYMYGVGFYDKKKKMSKGKCQMFLLNDSSSLLEYEDCRDSIKFSHKCNFDSEAINVCHTSKIKTIKMIPGKHITISSPIQYLSHKKCSSIQYIQFHYTLNDKTFLSDFITVKENKP